MMDFRVTMGELKLLDAISRFNLPIHLQQNQYQFKIIE